MLGVRFRTVLNLGIVSFCEILCLCNVLWVAHVSLKGIHNDDNLK